MTSLTAPPTLILEPSRLKRLTVQDYHRMSELGILDPGERTELIAGQIVLMVAKGTPHVRRFPKLNLPDHFVGAQGLAPLQDGNFFDRNHLTSLHLLANDLRDQLKNNALVRTQAPIQLDDYSEPEPDLAIVQGTVLDYADHHPRPSDIYLLVEVADSTLKQDCEIKDKLYAQAGIADYWVVDLKNRQLHIFRNPTPTGYTSHLILSEPTEISPLAFPHITLSLTAILPPAVLQDV
jgi:Uma2 family endonuclease